MGRSVDVSKKGSLIRKIQDKERSKKKQGKLAKRNIMENIDRGTKNI